MPESEVSVGAIREGLLIKSWGLAVGNHLARSAQKMAAPFCRYVSVALNRRNICEPFLPRCM